MSDKVIYIYNKSTTDISMVKNLLYEPDMLTTTDLSEAELFADDTHLAGKVNAAQINMGTDYTVYSGNPTTPPPPPPGV